MGRLYYEGYDGIYHKLSDVKEFQESIKAADDKLFEYSDSDQGSIRRLSEDGFFNQEINFNIVANAQVLEQITSEIDKVFKEHIALTELYWIAELAKRYIIEHSEMSNVR